MIVRHSDNLDWPNDLLFVWVTPQKAPMIAFETNDSNLVWSFNWAIMEANKKHDLHLFHQIGVIKGENDPGFHGWETWTNKSADELNDLLPEIQKNALEHFERWKE